MNVAIKAVVNLAPSAPVAVQAGAVSKHAEFSAVLARQGSETRQGASDRGVAGGGKAMKMVAVSSGDVRGAVAAGGAPVRSSAPLPMGASSGNTKKGVRSDAGDAGGLQVLSVVAPAVAQQAAVTVPAPPIAEAATETNTTADSSASGASAGIAGSPVAAGVAGQAGTVAAVAGGQAEFAVSGSGDANAGVDEDGPGDGDSSVGADSSAAGVEQSAADQSAPAVALASAGMPVAAGERGQGAAVSREAAGTTQMDALTKQAGAMGDAASGGRADADVARMSAVMAPLVNPAASARPPAGAKVSDATLPANGVVASGSHAAGRQGGSVGPQHVAGAALLQSGMSSGLSGELSLPAADVLPAGARVAAAATAVASQTPAIDGRVSMLSSGSGDRDGGGHGGGGERPGADAPDAGAAAQASAAVPGMASVAAGGTPAAAAAVNAAGAVPAASAAPARATGSGTVATGTAKADGDEVSGAGGAPATGAVNAAQLVRSLSGAELRVGFRSDDFGAVNIRTTLGGAQLSAHIAVENDRLGSALNAHLSTMQDALGERLGQALGVKAAVSVSAESGTGGQGQQGSTRDTASGAFPSDGGRGGSGRTGGESRQRPGRGGYATASVTEGSALVAAGSWTYSNSQPGAVSGRLDIRI